jgi:sulfhydrogenase subunit alpha
VTGPGERTRHLEVGALARVEGEGALRVRVRDGRVEQARLDIYEPPRFFEALLRGRAHTEPPDLTARICGICPVAYQTSACAAVEDACGVDVPEQLRDLRRLLYCGEWISSHAMHIYLLHAPDFLGYDGALELARDARPLVERGLRLKKAGDTLMTALGGRSVHPVNVRVGGFYRLPSRQDARDLVPGLRQARADALETVRWAAGLDAPDTEVDHELVALRTRDGAYPIETGAAVATTGGLSFPASAFERHVVEEQVEHSTALHARLVGRPGPYLTGPLARYALNADRLTPLAREAAADAGLGPVCRNPYRSIVVRAVEVLHACDEALRLAQEWDGAPVAAVPVPPRAGTGYGVSEAPRGLLYHRYDLDVDGTVLAARIVPPTSQNQRSIESQLAVYVQEHLGEPDEQLTLGCERVIRNADPCISCATHFLRVSVDGGPGRRP